jgi:hypothetical protein
MGMKNALVGEVDLSGSMTQQETKSLPHNDSTHPHIANMGKAQGPTPTPARC